MYVCLLFYREILILTFLFANVTFSLLHFVNRKFLSDIYTEQHPIMYVSSWGELIIFGTPLFLFPDLVLVLHFVCYCTTVDASLCAQIEFGPGAPYNHKTVLYIQTILNAFSEFFLCQFC